MKLMMTIRMGVIGMTDFYLDLFERIADSNRVRLRTRSSFEPEPGHF